MPRVKNPDPKPAKAKKAVAPPPPEPEPATYLPNRFDLAVESWAQRRLIAHRRETNQLDRAEALYRAADIAFLTGADPVTVLDALGPNYTIPESDATKALRAEVECGRLQAVDQASLMATFLEAWSLDASLTVPAFLAAYGEDDDDVATVFYAEAEEEEEEEETPPFEVPPKPKPPKPVAFEVGDRVLYRPPTTKSEVTGTIKSINKTGSLAAILDDNDEEWSSISTKYFSLLEEDEEDEEADDDEIVVEEEEPAGPVRKASKTAVAPAAPPKPATNGAPKKATAAKAAVPTGVTQVVISVPHKAAEAADRILRARKAVKGSPLGEIVKGHSYSTTLDDLVFTLEVVNESDPAPYAEVFVRNGHEDEPLSFTEPIVDSILGVYSLKAGKRRFEVHVAAE